MKNLLLVISRELVERKMLMIGAFAIGLVILAVPLVTRAPARDTWNIASLYLPIMLGLGIAGFAASSFVASDLREQRLSFFLGRPLSTASVWGGKMLAAWLLAILCALLVLLPATVVGSGLMFWLTAGEGGPMMLVMSLVASAVIIPFGHAAGVALRARSPWLLADFVALALFGLVTAAALRPLFHQYAFRLVYSTILVLAAFLTVTLLIGGYVGLSRGRIDLRSAHAHQSMISSGALIALGIAVSLFVVWVRSVDAEDLTEFRLMPCVTDCEPMLVGTSRGRGDYRAHFAMSGEGFRQLDFASEVGQASDRGRTVWLSAESIEPPTARVGYLDPGMERSVRTNILAHPYNSWIAVSPDGERLAIAEDRTLQIFNLDEERVIRTVRLPDAADSSFRVWFLNQDQILVLTPPAGRGPLSPEGGRSTGWTGVVADVESGDTREVEFATYPHAIDSDRGLLMFEDESEITVYRAGSSEPLFTTEGTSAVSTSHGVFVTRPRSRQVAVVDPGSGTERIYPLPADVTDIALGPADEESMILGLTRRSQFQRWSSSVPNGARLVRLDLTTGELEEMEEGIVPARAYQPGISGPYFLRDTPSGMQLIRIDPGSSEMTVLAGGTA
ncbi:MAG: hypothetical protein KY459_00305 [Acidobacteria bacterium]|nr:hypothetical protein [Acidobacteriota bacterium]